MGHRSIHVAAISAQPSPGTASPRLPRPSIFTTPFCWLAPRSPRPSRSGKRRVRKIKPPRLHNRNWRMIVMTDHSSDALRAQPALVSDRAGSHDTFWSKVSIGNPTECWLWTKSLRQGYGVYWNGKKNVAAHRFSVEISGRDIPASMVVDHTCRNRSCVNPAHLRVVTRYQNVHENSRAIAHLKSLQTHCGKGHELVGSNLRNRKGKRLCRECERLWQSSYRAKNKAAHHGN